ncbi:MAG: hypothetical protein GW928_08450 [Rhodoferax sp.]|nr:hypothetical protein [Betaproteobacteria bacterium]NCN97458.1 hypothetical protein [Rhodoferax sp.]NCP82654.1 hypothetical protein [Rhodoferax sp.]NCS62471.1 hypothetical protein [Rhodoferax sp.]
MSDAEHHGIPYKAARRCLTTPLASGYLDFTATGKLLGSGMGFGVNRP